MSDGDNATPGRPRASDSNGANEWLTRSPRPPRAAAPWERQPAAEPEDTDTSPPTGSHTDGVTVADLIAKITGSVADGSAEPARCTRAPNRRQVLTRRRAATAASRPRQPRQLRPTAEPQPEDLSDPDTEVIPVVSYADEIPDLAALRRARLERVAPERVGEPSAESADPPTTNQSRGAGSCWRAVPLPPSSPCSRWR